VQALFVDTSALVKYYYPEKDSDRIEDLLLKARQVFISSLSITEMASALMKKVRMGELKKTEELLIWNTFLDDLGAGRIDVLMPDERQYERAADIIREIGSRHGIRTLDAIQLAVAQSAGNVSLLCSDKVMTTVAKKMGMQVIS
jgi:predicted nucleic acid-binding protein